MRARGQVKGIRGWRRKSFAQQLWLHSPPFSPSLLPCRPINLSLTNKRTVKLFNERSDFHLLSAINHPTGFFHALPTSRQSCTCIRACCNATLERSVPCLTFSIAEDISARVCARVRALGKHIIFFNSIILLTNYNFRLWRNQSILMNLLLFYFAKAFQEEILFYFRLEAAKDL